MNKSPYYPFYEGVAPPALLVEGATQAPIIVNAFPNVMEQIRNRQQEVAAHA